MFSDKQKDAIKGCTAKINILEGAVRSGKTYASLWGFMGMLTYGEAGEYALLSKTYDSFKRNIFPQLFQMVGMDARHYSGKRELHLWGKTVHVIGCDDERSESKIRGATFQGAYVDEATIIPESCFKMLISRCALGKSKIIATTNPDSPFHWLNKDYLQNNTDVKSWQFKLEDNPCLTIEEINYLKRQYKGLWYKRYIEGLWVQAEGTIYDFFNEEAHCIGWAPVDAKYHILGIDYGTHNPFAAVLVGYNPHNYPNMWVEDEFYWDSKLKGRQKSDSDYAEDVKRLCQHKNVRAIYIDPSAASMKVELRRAGLNPVVDAVNDVIPGIRKVTELLIHGTLKVVRSCPNLVKEFHSYVWDSKAASRGVDAPVKAHDHCFCAGTMVWTSEGDVPIEDIKVGDLVYTRSGLRKVLRTGFNFKNVRNFEVAGRSFRCTPDHKFFTERGWISIAELIPFDTLYIRNESWVNTDQQKSSNLTGIFTDAIQNLKSLLKECTSREMESISIEKCGSTIKEKFLKDFIFITKMGTPITMICPILNVYPLLNTLNCTQKNTLKDLFHKLLTKLPKNGIVPTREKSGIANTPYDVNLENLHPKNLSATSAETSILQLSNPTTDFVQINVSLHGGEQLDLIMSVKSAQHVAALLTLTNIPDNYIAPEPVLGQECKEKVFNLEVEEDHEFFANGVLVKNSLDALRYALYTHQFDGSSGVDWDKVRREALQGPF